ncbi:MAG: transporter [Bacteroidales bacterium]|nr:transporter [Bacteroidales bacterium]
MKKTIIIISILLGTINLQAQVGGISASKLVTICTETVPANGIEFEPSFYFNSSSMAWSDAGKKQSIFSNTDSSQIKSGFAFRFSYGLTKNLETGVTVSGNMTIANWGFKYHFLNKKKTSLAIIGGINTPLGNRTTDKNNKSTENVLASGLVMTLNFSEKFNMDADIQYQQHLFEQAGHHHQDFFFNTDLGYYLVDKVQVVSGFNFSFADGDITQYQLIFNPGVTVEKADNFILVMQFPYTVLGKNSCQSFGFGMALTIMID